MKDEIWNKITSSLKTGKRLELLHMRKNAQAFIIDEISSNYIRIQFEDSKTFLILEKSRFDSAYEFLNKNKGNWVSVGSSRMKTKPNTLEGIIKKEFDNNKNGIATAAWIAAILVKAFDEIEFNGKVREQAIKMI